jgi:DNA gyrase subunit A
MNVREGDKLLGVKLCNPGDHIFIPTKDGQAIHFDETELRPIGRTAMGVRGITLDEGDEVVDLVVSTPDTKILSITEHGYGKLSALDLYRTTHRGGKGVINIKLRDEGDKLIAAKAIKTNENLLLASSKGHLIRIRSEDVRETGRAAKGVIVMKLDEDDSITSVALCDAAEEVGEIILSKEKTTVTEEPEEEQSSEIKVGKNDEVTPAEPEEEVDEEDFRVKHHEDDDSDDE